jgi:hypothetical protein
LNLIETYFELTEEEKESYRRRFRERSIETCRMWS